MHFEITVYNEKRFTNVIHYKKHMTARLESAKRHLKDSQTMRNRILYFDETEIELFGLNAQDHLWGCFSAAGAGRLVRIDEKMNGAKYTEILNLSRVGGSIRNFG